MSENTSLMPIFVVLITFKGEETNRRGKSNEITISRYYSIPSAFQPEHYHPELKRLIRNASDEDKVNRHLRNIDTSDEDSFGLCTYGQDHFEVTDIVFETTTKKDLGEYQSVLEIITEFYPSEYRAIRIVFTKESKKYVVHHPFPHFSKHQRETDQDQKQRSKRLIDQKKDQKHMTDQERDQLVERYEKIYRDKNCEKISVSFCYISDVLSDKLRHPTFCYWTPDIPPIKPQPTAYDLKFSKLEKELSHMNAMSAAQQEQIAQMSAVVAAQQEQIASLNTLFLEMQKMISAQQPIISE